MPSMRSITITSVVHQSQYISGTSEQIRVGEIAAQLAGVGGLAHQVEFVAQIFLEFGHYLARLEALAVCPPAFHQPGADFEQCDIVRDDRTAMPGRNIFTATSRAIRQHGEMHLRHRGAGHRPFIEVSEHLAELLFISGSSNATACADGNGGT